MKGIIVVKYFRCVFLVNFFCDFFFFIRIANLFEKFLMVFFDLFKEMVFRFLILFEKVILFSFFLFKINFFSFFGLNNRRLLVSLILLWRILRFLRLGTLQIYILYLLRFNKRIFFLIVSIARI